MTLDLNISNRDYARFLPAINSNFARILSEKSPFKDQHERMPDCFPNGLQSINFLDEDKGLFSYNWALYSAGHAMLDIEKGDVSESFIQKRNKEKIILVGDSGGFQVAKGILKFPWGEFKESGGKCDNIRLKILKWLEHTADWSMILDVPGFGVNFDTGLKTFKECLDYTCYNNDFFVKWRDPGTTKFLNVLQGSDFNTAEQWYQAVKKYSDPKIYGENAFEGWSMGGENMRWWYLILYRLIQMRDEKLFENKNWMHFLGTGHLPSAIQITAIKRNLNKIYPDLEVSFDSASAFLAPAKGLCYERNSFTPKRFSYIMGDAKDDKKLIHDESPYTTPFINKKKKLTEVAKSVVMHPTKDTFLKTNDICIRGYDYPNKTSWDVASYNFLMAHNTYMHITAVQNANKLADERNVDCVPKNLLEFVDLANEVFTSEKPMEMIENYKQLLNEVSTARYTGPPQRNLMEDFYHNGIIDEMPGFTKKMEKEKKVFETNTFDNLFD